MNREDLETLRAARLSARIAQGELKSLSQHLDELLDRLGESSPGAPAAAARPDQQLAPDVGADG
jgi:hypothetical protein